MDPLSRARRVGLTAVSCALALRLWTAGIPGQLLSFLTRPDTAAFLIYLETGRNVRFSPSLSAFSPHFTESARPSAPEPQVPSLPAFSGSENVDLYYGCDLRPDVQALLRRPLSWDLTQGEPAVLILHTHTTEGYAEDAASGWRTQSEEGNMLSVGDRVARKLRESGIGVVQDRQLNDHPSYNGSYVRSRKTVKAYLEEYPTIRLVLDLHRDASGDGTRQLRTLAALEGTPCAQLMLVLGTNHAGYEENLSLALKLHSLLEQRSPGITRPLQLRAQRFNQDLSSGALLVEVGAAGNTREEALLAADALSEAIIALARGTAEK